MEDMIVKAEIFATQAHALVEQKRKYTGEDYIVHPIRVAKIVEQFGGSDNPPLTYTMLWRIQMLIYLMFAWSLGMILVKLSMDSQMSVSPVMVIASSEKQWTERTAQMHQLKHSL
jgi:hypothetical protein